MEEKTILVTFTAEESQLYEMIQTYCAGQNKRVSDYIKDIVKKDFAWGHFARRRKRDGRRTHNEDA